jgi:hypothetical protein
MVEGEGWLWTGVCEPTLDQPPLVPKPILDLIFTSNPWDRRFDRIPQTIHLLDL